MMLTITFPSRHVCTLPHGCFEYTDSNLSKSVKSVHHHNDAALSLAAGSVLKLTPEALTCVEQLLKVRQQNVLPKKATSTERVEQT